MSRSWAQIASTGITKPSPLRQHNVLPLRPSSPSPFPSAAALSPATDDDKTPLASSAVLVSSPEMLIEGVKYTWADIAASRPGSEPGSAFVQVTKEDEGKGRSQVGVPSSPRSDTTSTATTTTSPSSSSATISISQNMARNKKRMEKKAAKAAAAATAAAAKADNIGGTPGRAATASPSPALIAKGEGEGEEKNNKGKEKAVQLLSDDEPGGSSTEVLAKVEVTIGAESKDEALKRAMLASLERGRRRGLYGARNGHDVTIALGKDGASVKCHREILVADSGWFAAHLPPADEKGMSTINLSAWSMNMISSILTFMYTGELPGMQLNTSNRWDLRCLIPNVSTYRTAADLGIETQMKWHLKNIEDIRKYFGPLLAGQFYYYQVPANHMAHFEIPLRMSFICIYEEKHNPDATLKMKLALSNLMLVMFPFIRRQIGFQNYMADAWEKLPFPLLEDMKSFYHDGLLPEYSQYVDESGNWIEDTLAEPHIEEEELGVPGPSSGAPTYYMASIEEIAHRAREGGVPM